MKLLILFIALTVFNVIIQTVKSIATIKCGKGIASLVNSVAYGTYTYLVFFTADGGLNLHTKALVTALANLVGVYLVKLIEEKSRKDKLWKVECAIPREKYETGISYLNLANISYNCTQAGDWSIFNCYCATQKETQIVVDLAKNEGGKISAYESKNLIM